MPFLASVSYPNKIIVIRKTIISVIEGCIDFSADGGNCTKFIRCFYNLRILFTCPPGTAWEDSLKTCVWANAVAACNTVQKQRKIGISYCLFVCVLLITNILSIFIEVSSKLLTYVADVNALNNIRFGRSLAEARALGPIVTPRQYRCSHCNTGMCGVVVNTIQCFCGNTQCPPSTPAPTSINIHTNSI